MPPKKLEKAQWRSFCNYVSKTLRGTRAEVEVASLPIGAQIEAEWVFFEGIVYDSKSAMVEILLEGVDHMIRNPQEIHVDYGVGGLLSMQIVDGDGTRHLLKLRQPLALPEMKETA